MSDTASANAAAAGARSSLGASSAAGANTGANTSARSNEPGAVIAKLLPKLRTVNPLVYCLSNSVTAEFVANCLYAVGASPVFCVDPAEAEAMAGHAAAMVVNLGTLDQQRRQAIARAVPKAKRWVLDPVGVHAMVPRRRLALELMGQRPDIVRANASEILALDPENAGETPSARGGGRSQDGAERGNAPGVDTQHSGADAAPLAKYLGQTTHSVIALSGVTDYVAGKRPDGQGRMVQLAGGHGHMAKITGMGCSVSALCAAFLAVADPGPKGAFDAAVSALHLASAAGGHAGEQETTKGPASFKINFLDALSKVGAR